MVIISETTMYIVINTTKQRVFICVQICVQILKTLLVWCATATFFKGIKYEHF